MTRHIITIDHDNVHYELAFPKEHLSIANTFLNYQFGDGGAGYFELDFQRLHQAMEEKKEFSMTFNSEEELFEAIDKARDHNEKLTQYLDDAVATYRAESPQYRP